MQRHARIGACLEARGRSWPKGPASEACWNGQRRSHAPVFPQTDKRGRALSIVSEKGCGFSGKMTRKRNNEAEVLGVPAQLRLVFCQVKA
jgi:hypothetical protein